MDQREAVFNGVKKETRKIDRSKDEENVTIIEEEGVKSTMTEGPGTLGFKFETGPKEGTINVDISTPYNPHLQAQCALTLPYSPDWYEDKLAKMTKDMNWHKEQLKGYHKTNNKLQGEIDELKRQLQEPASDKDLLAEIERLNNKINDYICDIDELRCIIRLLSKQML